MKKLLTLLLVLVLSLGLVACGGESAPTEEAAPAEDAAPAPAAQEASADPDYDQLVMLTQTLYGMEESLVGIGTMGEDVKAGTISQEDALAAYASINEQASAVYNAVESAQWQGNTYDQEIEHLRQGAEAISLYTEGCYEAMEAGDAAALDTAAPYFETYMTQMDALLTALGF